ncbi:hypothetical protein BGZ51_003493 [Haplosporangium sp. Z 767]|nr:hypothetical protein BGZ51_003493 [Haplosporangium sp. Z 767]
MLDSLFDTCWHESGEFLEAKEPLGSKLYCRLLVLCGLYEILFVLASDMFEKKTAADYVKK